MTQGLRRSFPNGMAYHGLGWFYWQKDTAMYPAPGLAASASALERMRSAAIELVFEYVRQGHFSHCPSRFESVFAYDNRPEADAFRAASLSVHPNAQVVEVSGTEVFKADMGLLQTGTTVTTSWAAHNYWRGAAHPTQPPQWEVFLKPPVTVA